GDSSDLGLTWLGSLALLVAAVAVAGALLARIPWPSLDAAGLAFVGLLTAFVLWSGASVAWSIQPDRSWAYTNRGLVYFAFACLGVFLGSLLPRAPRAAAGALAVLLAGVLGWALLGKIFPSLFPDYGRLARLRASIGYWNALALLGADRGNRIPRERRRERVRYAMWGAGVLAVFAFAASTISAGGPSAWVRARVHEFTTPVSVTQTPRRVTSFSSNHRWTWWKESWHSFTKHPLAGTGAGSFALVHRPLRRTSL